ncbi:hypothetical protein C2E23DRAFT_622202 [Lenzites betulinus]|nr:hypothetical protein C2E23DRAFT_622202 [Lenzites betulinus]
MDVGKPHKVAQSPTTREHHVHHRVRLRRCPRDTPSLPPRPCPWALCQRPPRPARCAPASPPTTPSPWPSRVRSHGRAAEHGARTAYTPTRAPRRPLDTSHTAASRGPRATAAALSLPPRRRAFPAPGPGAHRRRAPRAPPPCPLSPPSTSPGCVVHPEDRTPRPAAASPRRIPLHPPSCARSAYTHASAPRSKEKKNAHFCVISWARRGHGAKTVSRRPTARLPSAASCRHALVYDTHTPAQFQLDPRRFRSRHFRHFRMFSIHIPTKMHTARRDRGRSPCNAQRRLACTCRVRPPTPSAIRAGPSCVHSVHFHVHAHVCADRIARPRLAPRPRAAQTRRHARPHAPSAPTKSQRGASKTGLGSRRRHSTAGAHTEQAAAAGPRVACPSYSCTGQNSLVSFRMISCMCMPNGDQIGHRGSAARPRPTQLGTRARGYGTGPCSTGSTGRGNRELRLGNSSPRDATRNASSTIQPRAWEHRQRKIATAARPLIPMPRNSERELVGMIPGLGALGEEIVDSASATYPHAAQFRT